MTPDDPRHGTKAGVSAHERDKSRLCQACKEFKNHYDLNASPRTCPDCKQTHTQRRKVCRACSNRRSRMRDDYIPKVLTEADLDPVTDWVKARSPRGFLILKRAS